MISVPKGLLRLAALRLLSESSLSGANLREEVVRASKGSWNPGPGSIYFMLRELLEKYCARRLPRPRPCRIYPERAARLLHHLVQPEEVFLWNSLPSREVPTICGLGVARDVDNEVRGEVAR